LAGVENMSDSFKVVNFERTAIVKEVLVGTGVDNAHASVWKKN
jgi:hypothetical protein